MMLKSIHQSTRCSPFGRDSIYKVKGLSTRAVGEENTDENADTDCDRRDRVTAGGWIERLRHRRPNSRHCSCRSAHGWEIMPRAWRQTHLCTHRRRYAGDGRPGSRRDPGWLCGTVRWITETPAEALELLEGIDLDAVVRTSFAPPVPETLAVAQVGGMGVAS